MTWLKRSWWWVVLILVGALVIGSVFAGQLRAGQRLWWKVRNKQRDLKLEVINNEMAKARKIQVTEDSVREALVEKARKLKLERDIARRRIDGMPVAEQVAELRKLGL